MKNIAITGVSGYLGTLIHKRLAQEPEIERIIGLDVREPTFRSPKLIFIKHDVRQPFDEIMRNNDVDTAIHLAFVVVPTHDENKTREINIGGSKNFLDACKKAKVAQVFYMGSHTEYGARQDNPAFFTEEMTLNPNPDYPYAGEKTQVDLMFQDFAKKNPDVCVTIGRTVAVTGPGGDASGLMALFLPVMIKASGKDPLWQFIHEDDLAEIVFRLLKNRQSGIYNLAGDGGLTYSQMIKMTGKASVTLPAKLLYRVVKAAWRARLQSRSQAGGLFLLEYPINVSNDKVKKATGYKLRYTGQEAFEAFIKAKEATENK